MTCLVHSRKFAIVRTDQISHVRQSIGTETTWLERGVLSSKGIWNRMYTFQKKGLAFEPADIFTEKER